MPVGVECIEERGKGRAKGAIQPSAEESVDDEVWVVEEGRLKGDVRQVEREAGGGIGLGIGAGVRRGEGGEGDGEGGAMEVKEPSEGVPVAAVGAGAAEDQDGVEGPGAEHLFGVVEEGQGSTFHEEECRGGGGGRWRPRRGHEQQRR